MSLPFLIVCIKQNNGIKDPFAVNECEQDGLISLEEKQLIEIFPQMEF